MKKCRWICILFITLIFLSTGCAQKETSDFPEDIETGAPDTFSTFPWQDGFLEKDSMEHSEHPYYEIRLSDIREPEIDGDIPVIRTAAAYSWKARYVSTSAQEQGTERYYLTRYDSDLSEGERTEILTNWEDRSQGLVIAMDMVEENLIALLFAEYDPDRQSGAQEYQLLFLDEEGTLLSVQPVGKGYDMAGISTGSLGIGTWWCDKDGYQYVKLKDGFRMVIIDPQGELVYEWTGTAPTEAQMETAFHMPDGSLVLCRSIYGEAKTELVWMEMPKQSEHIVWEHQGTGLRMFTVTPQGMMYYTEGGILYGWNLISGEKERLIQFSGTDIPAFSPLYLTVTDQQDLILHVLQSGKSIVMADTLPEQDTDMVQCVDLTGYGGLSFLRSGAASYNRENDGPDIRYTAATGDLGSEWIRLSAEIAAGKGPDIMSVDIAQMRALQEKGVLDNLEDYLTSDHLNNLINGIRQRGSVNGQIYGLCMEGYVRVLVTSDDIRTGNKWTIEDILEKIDQSEELEALFINFTGGADPYTNLNFLSGICMGNSPFYDEKESYFECEEFQRLLEICKKYGTEKVYSEQGADALLREGKVLAVEKWIPTAGQFMTLMTTVPDQIHFIGYPGQTQGCGIWMIDRAVIVNQKAKNKEAIAEFLNYILEPAQQENVTFHVINKSAIHALVNYYSYYDNSNDFIEGYTYPNIVGTINLETKEDGTTYIPEYIEFLDNCGIWETDHRIWEIVEEEVGSYWDGSKSAQQVAKIIDNRVQLYLDENSRN